MSEQPKVIKVSRDQIEAAKLGIRFAKIAGDPVPPIIELIANAKPPQKSGAKQRATA